MNILNTSSEQHYTEEIDITPDISLMPKLSFTGYSAPQAIAELVDNSIDARIEGLKLKVSVTIKKDSITVADNGTGMNKNIAAKSLVLAFSRKKDKLGEFGLGLKTACLSLGDYFEIITKDLNEGSVYNICFDKIQWQNSDKGWKLPLIKKPANNKDHFSIINIRKLKVAYANLQNYIRNDLKKRYAPFIRAQEVEIKVNDKKCHVEDFALLEDTKKDFNIELKSGNRIHGWYALLKEGSQKGFYGFSTFRRGRMITAYDKIGFEPHPTLARIVGEIHMDHVQPTTNKREFEKETSQYREIEAAMKEELKDLLKLARRKATQDTVTPEVKNEVDIWKNKITDALRSEEFKSYTARFKNIDPTCALEGKEKEEVEIEKREKPGESPTNDPKATNERTRTPKETHKQQRHILRIKGKTIEFSHKFAQLGVDQPWKIYKFSMEEGLEIFTNTDFPAYLVTKDKPFYAVIHIAEAISEVLVQVAQEDAANMDELKGLILRKASELKAQI